ncbi:MAG TPA: glycosyltransferase family 39 protein [Caldilineae bacterium]|nr:glycosyltransferase family 39 protein [Caldilineae bacterium]
MRLRDDWPLAVILLAFLILGTIYSVVNPLFEAPDEVWHYEYVRWLVEGHGLPRPEQVGNAPWHQEGSQPPLYYMLAALVTYPIPTDNAAEVIRYNPHAAMGRADAFGNKNVIVHGRADAWPWRGVALAAHMVRFLSLLMGAATVLCTYGTARTIFPGQRTIAAAAAALVAFNPQFLFLSAAVNNDNLVIACSAAGIWLLVRLLAQEKPRRYQLVLLGVLLGVAALSKLNGLLLFVPTGLTLSLIAWRRRSFGDLIR